jgi:hypothetical protein
VLWSSEWDGMVCIILIFIVIIVYIVIIALTTTTNPNYVYGNQTPSITPTTDPSTTK